MLQVKKILYNFTDKTYLHFENDAIVIRQNGEEKQKIPIALIEQIVIFGHTTISDYLVKACTEQGILISYVSDTGTYYGTIYGPITGNVVLRHKQHLLYENKQERLKIVKNIVLGKAINQLAVMRKLSSPMDPMVKEKISIIHDLIGGLKDADAIDKVRGIEGVVAAQYFECFDKFLTVHNPSMMFIKRSRRPADNNVNALLSFLYTMLASNCVTACETFSLDPYLGLMHTIRPGRASLALDLMEELRAPLVDQLIVNWINHKTVSENDFQKDSNVITLKPAAKTKVIQLWEEWKNQKIWFPLYQQEVPQKLLPYLQAQLLAQTIRGDVTQYPPWHMEE